MRFCVLPATYTQKGKKITTNKQGRRQGKEEKATSAVRVAETENTITLWDYNIREGGRLLCLHWSFLHSGVLYQMHDAFPDRFIRGTHKGVFVFLFSYLTTPQCNAQRNRGEIKSVSALVCQCRRLCLWSLMVCSS